MLAWLVFVCMCRSPVAVFCAVANRFFLRSFLFIFSRLFDRLLEYWYALAQFLLGLGALHIV
jgi:hypothetical protein